jgi:hypothetical protein
MQPRDLDEVAPPAPGYGLPRRPIQSSVEDFAPRRMLAPPREEPPVDEDPRQLLGKLAQAMKPAPIDQVREIVRNFTHDHLMEMAAALATSLETVGFKPVEAVSPTMDLKSWIVAGVLNEWAKAKPEAQ